MDDTTIAALNQMGTLYGNAKGFAMPGAANAARAGDHTASHRRRLGGGILIGGILSIFAFVITTLIWVITGRELRILRLQLYAG